MTSLALRAPRLVLLAALLLTTTGGWLGSRLSLQTDLSELLPPQAESVVALKALNLRVGGTGGVAVALSGEPAALRKFVPELVAVLRRGLGSDLLAIRYQKKEVDDYFARFAAWYVDDATLAKWDDQLGAVIADEKARANPGFVELGEPHAAAKQLIGEVRAQKRKIGQHHTADEESGLLLAEGGRLAVIFLRPAANTLNLAASRSLLEKIRGLIIVPPGVKLEGFTGSIPTAIAEFAAIERDIAGTALLVVLLVGGVVVLYFRSLRELILLSLALAVGAASAFAFAYLWIGHVNAQTAFLGCIIVGTGINYGILLLAKLDERRRSGMPLQVALEEAVSATLRATSIAALATAVSFGVLSAGQVESFHQFGWIGGVGILMCWLATYTVVPAAVVLWDRPPATKRRTPLSDLCAAVGRLVEQRRRLVVAGCLLLTALSLFSLWRRRTDPLETNLANLGTRSSSQSGIQKLDQRLRGMDPGSSTPAVIPTDSREEAKQICDVLQPIADATHEQFLGHCWTVDVLLPKATSRPLLSRLRDHLSQLPLTLLDDGDRRELASLQTALAERAPGVADLPPTLVEPFRERDGSIGKLAFVDPKHDEVAQNLFAFANAIREIHLPSGKVIHSSGENVVFADLLMAVEGDARRLTAAAALGVLLVLLVMVRRAGSFLRVAAALLIGVAWMLGAAALFGQKLNFFNFVALPTTFGIAIDYAINVEERLRRGGSLGEVGPAVILCSATTILGYLSLLIADNQALVSFGRLAIAGEAACLVAALLVVPALWGGKVADLKPGVGRNAADFKSK